MKETLSLKRTPRFALLVLLLSALFAVGCSGDQQNKTIQGLQEQTKVQQEKITYLEDHIVNLNNEKQDVNQSSAGRIEQLKREFEDRLVKSEELHRSKISQLEGEIANLRLELGAIQREKLALQEMVDREPRVQSANSARREYDTLVLGFMIAILIALLMFVLQKYRSVQDRLNLLVMQQTSELRRIGAKL